jgi:hypothetical protein
VGVTSSVTPERASHEIIVFSSLDEDPLPHGARSSVNTALSRLSLELGSTISSFTSTLERWTATIILYVHVWKCKVRFFL